MPELSITMKSLYEIFREYTLISTDSRNISPGCIFFALKGPNFNGNTFSEKALSLGASYVVIDEPEYKKDERYIVVEDVLKALQDLAHEHRKQINIPVLAITGSNGKTTTKELIRNVLAKKFNTLATIGNLNNHIGVPLTILSITKEMEFAVIEMGANHLKEIESYCKIAEPDYGLITNVGKAHLEGFGGFEGVKKGKGELYEWIKKKGKGVFLNNDNPLLISMAGTFKIPQVIRYGTGDSFYCSGTLLGERPFLTLQWKSEGRLGHINSQLTGAYNFENILSAICVGNYFGVSAADIKDAIESYRPDNSRSQLVKKGSNTIILDAYNANPTSMEAALTNFAKLEIKNRVVFLGDMAELGEESDAEHKRITGMLKKAHYTRVILVGKNFGKFKEELDCIYFDDSEKAAEWVKTNPLTNTTILIKGSRSTKMEKVFEAI